MEAAVSFGYGNEDRVRAPYGRRYRRVLRTTSSRRPSRTCAERMLRAGVEREGFNRFPRVRKAKRLQASVEFL